MSIKKRVLFMGTPDYATTIFETLLKSEYELIGLFTQPDKKVGRKQLLTPPHIKQFCLDNNLAIPIFQPLSLRNDETLVSAIKDLKPNYIVVAAYGQILPKEILDLAPCINLHASLLPKYRGASPIQEALLNDDKFTGVTSMLMEEGLDTGDILGLQYLKITPTMEVSETFELLSKIAANLTIKTLDKFDYIEAKKQNNSNSSLCKKIKKEYGEISFSDAKVISQKYKAYSYWPGIFLTSGLKLKNVTLIESYSKNIEGEILEVGTDFVNIGCKIGSLKIKELQAPSKKSICASSYVRGKRLEIKDLLT